MGAVVLPVEVVPRPGTSNIGLEAATEDLRESLVRRGIAVTHGTTPAPEGTKSPEAAALGTLLVTVLSQPAALEHLAGVIGRWVRHAGRYRVVAKINDSCIDFETESPELVRRVIEAWIEQASPPR
jgi:hypothetical protein